LAERRRSTHGPGTGAPTPGDTLFSSAARREGERQGTIPLAERVRPRTLDAYVGQAHVVGPKKLLGRLVREDRVPSMILWGPPGVGKTTLGRIIADATRAAFVAFSAVLGTVAELRDVIAAAKDRLAFRGERTIVFVDEIHRFNKAQQDAFLPHVEAGTITLVGATTENPSFSVNAALLSRVKVFHLEPLGEEDLRAVLDRALADEARGLGREGVTAPREVLAAIARAAGGDARRALGTLEVAVLDAARRGVAELTVELVAEAEERAPLLYDKDGDQHHDLTSAFIKSMRGSDPDAAIYWLVRMVDAGEDPLFLLRRMMIFASEDVGNADPRALVVAASADQAFRRMGLPEGMYPLAHAAIYLACAPKSNAVTLAWHRARARIAETGSLPVPKKLRSATTRLARAEGYGADYRYPHDFEGGVAPGETYLPEALVGERWYEPTGRGEEAKIAARLEEVRRRRLNT
jgi:putative ATPase